MEGIERNAGSTAQFQKKPWQRDGGGGGLACTMTGDIFEKIGVNISHVEGPTPNTFKAQFQTKAKTFHAGGVSFVAHPRNPLVPAGHMNVRMISFDRAWFGGGSDLTPTFAFEEDTAHFHQALRHACAPFSPNAYRDYAKACDAYFYLPHRDEPRGVGGIFFDQLPCDQDSFALVKRTGHAFAKVYAELVRRHQRDPWGEAEKQAQLRKRGRYAEFNLLYDRGTRFGLDSGGNTEAILMSLPPLAAWPVPDETR